MDSPRGSTPPDAYTFPDDGYDYSQHFAARGDGVFIRADGVVVQPEDRAPDVVVPVVDIPDDVPADILAALDGAPDAGSSDGDVDAVFAALQADAAEQRAADAAFDAALDEWDCAEAGGVEFDEDAVRAALSELGGGAPPGAGRREKRGKRRIDPSDLEADPEAIARQVERQRREEEAAEAAAAARRAARASQASGPSGVSSGAAPSGSSGSTASGSTASPSGSGSGSRGRRVKPKTIKAPKRR